MKKQFLISLALFLSVLLASACSAPQYQPISKTQQTPYLSEHSAVMSDGYRLTLNQHKANQPKAVIIALHGFNDYRNAFTPLCDYLSERQIHCIRYDQRGFGETEHRGLWPRNNELQHDLATLTKLVKQQYPNLPLYVIGESMGGAVVLTTFAEHALPHVEGIAALAPAVWARHTQPWYQRLALWLTVRIAPGWKPTGKGFERVVTDNYDMLRALSKDPLVIKGTRIDTLHGLNNLMDKALQAAKRISTKGLILYGDKDELITKKPTCRLLANAKKVDNNWRFVLYSQGYHMLSRDLQAENVYKDLISWIDNPGSRFKEELSLQNDEWQTDYCDA